MSASLSDIKPILMGGGVVMLPTETVYGIAALADNAKAIDRIYDIKGREFNKSLAVCVSGILQAKQLANLSSTAQSLADKFWPGPLTLVLPAKDTSLNPRCYQGDTIALRCPDVHWRENLTARPLALTSANKSGEAEALTAYTDLAVDAILDGGRVTGGTPSTILTVRGDKITLLREGALGAAQLADYDIEPAMSDGITQLMTALPEGSWTQDVDIIAPHLSEWRDKYFGNTPLMLTPRNTEGSRASR